MSKSPHRPAGKAKPQQNINKAKLTLLCQPGDDLPDPTTMVDNNEPPVVLPVEQTFGVSWLCVCVCVSLADGGDDGGVLVVVIEFHNLLGASHHDTNKRRV